MRNETSSTRVLSTHPIQLPVPGRPRPIDLRISAPVEGDDLPLLLLSHGHGPSNFLSSLHGYGPLAEGLAARGFVVVQPTHLDSKTLPLRESDHPDAPLFWRSRAQDMSYILDVFETVEHSLPTLAGRVDSSRAAVVGHSMGGHTASVLIGARHRLDDGTLLACRDERIRAGVLLAAPGRGAALSSFAKAHYPFLATIDFSEMRCPALVVVGDADDGPFMKTVGSSWHADPYHLAPPPKSLLTLFGGEHGLGGVAGYDAAETTDEHPARVRTLVEVVSAYLRNQLLAEDGAWRQRRALMKSHPLGRIESK